MNLYFLRFVIALVGLCLIGIRIFIRFYTSKGSKRKRIFEIRYKERETQPLRIPSLRQVLIYIHKDLFMIERKTLLYEGYFYKLSDFEILVLVLEDRRFLQHRGVDLVACIREIVKALLLRKHGGASTIDMQFVRTATGYREKTLRRKLYEIFLAMLIQYRYPKRTILRSYLKCAFFGSHLIGIERASKEVFGIYPHQLKIEQAAFLAAMLVYPRPLQPTEKWLAKVTKRAEYGYRRMLRLKQSFQQVPG